MKDIAASRIDNGPGSRLQGALIDESELALDTLATAFYSDVDLLGLFDHSLMQHSPPLGGTPGLASAKLEAEATAQIVLRKTSQRFNFAFLGGIAIIIPAMVIVMHKAPGQTRATTCASILVFACSVAILSTASPENLLVAIAAYSAVQMVFFGSYS